jgi:hypothetical protein
VAQLVRGRTGGWPVLTGPGARAEAAKPDAQTANTTDGPILWLCGASGVGKSTVGFAVYLRAPRAGLSAAYLDLDQIGFCSTAPPGDPRNHRAKARILAALWRTCRSARAQCLIMVGPAEDQAAVKTYRHALPAAIITVCRLHAGPAQLTRRILLRGQGGSWPQPGDPLNGQSTAQLLHAADKATADADAIERAAIGDLRVDTDTLTVEEAADAIVSRTTQPGAARTAGTELAATASTSSNARTAE